MTLRPGIFVAGASGGVTAPQDARLAVAGLLSGVGLLAGGAVTGSSSGPNMKYTIAPGTFVTARAAASDGLYVFANDGALTLDSGAPAPSSGSRWDLIWVRHQNAIEGGSDSVSTPIGGVTVGTSGSSPTKPYASVPADALVLAEASVGTSIANASLAVISQVAGKVTPAGVQGVWTDYTPHLTRADTGATLASTVNRARYMIIGKTCFVQGDVTAGANSTGGAAVDLPFTSKDRVLDCGTLAVFQGSGAATPSDQCGIALMTSDKARLVVVSYTGGFRDVSTNNVIRWDTKYELP